jgi:hypothetical protein
MRQFPRICGIYDVLYMMPGMKHFARCEINWNPSVVYVMIIILSVRFSFRWFVFPNLSSRKQRLIIMTCNLVWRACSPTIITPPSR